MEYIFINKFKYHQDTNSYIHELQVPLQLKKGTKYRLNFVYVGNSLFDSRGIKVRCSLNSNPKEYIWRIDNISSDCSYYIYPPHKIIKDDLTINSIHCTLYDEHDRLINNNMHVRLEIEISLFRVQTLVQRILHWLFRN